MNFRRFSFIIINANIFYLFITKSARADDDRDGGAAAALVPVYTVCAMRMRVVERVEFHSAAPLSVSSLMIYSDPNSFAVGTTLMYRIHHCSDVLSRLHRTTPENRTTGEPIAERPLSRPPFHDTGTFAHPDRGQYRRCAPARRPDARQIDITFQLYG